MAFPRKRCKNCFVNDTPKGAIATCHESGWINESIFVQFIDRVIKYSKFTVQEPILIILNNHHSRGSLSVVQKAKDSGIELLTMPPHTLHKLQPLDVSVFGSFKVFYSNAIDDWLRSHSGKMVSIYDIPKMVTTSFNSGVIRHNIVAGFAATEISYIRLAETCLGIPILFLQL